MSQPKKDPFLPEDKQPQMECMTCGYYKKSEKDETTDWMGGSCKKSGLSHVPPRHTCSAWCKHRRNESC